jgi:nucleotide-binding universal stress UspA family protein
MYHRIVVSLDGSPLGERALPYAALLAGRSAARLLLVHVHVGSLAARVDPFAAVEPVNPTSLAEAAAAAPPASTGDEITAYLDALASRPKERGLAAEVRLVHGNAGDAIVRAAREEGADLIVMCTHGRSGFGRWLYGSVADHVLRHATVPVLLVPARGTPLQQPEGIQAVLVPLDGSDLAEAVLRPASELATLLGTGLVLVQAIEPATNPYTELSGASAFDPGPRLAAAREYLERVAAALRDQGRDVQALAAAGSAFEVIGAAVREHGAGITAMATHGRGGLVRAVLGSVATTTLQRSDVPLLLVRPRHRDGREELGGG